ncbi:unnamed protein product [Rhizophagus irregularis]|nr:unnamed protein product [Rhizophagus irregularis]
MDGRENSSSKLIGQIAAFRNNLPPYNDEFIPKYYTVEHWWNYVEQDEGEENFIQQLALKYTAKDMNAKNDEEFYQLVRNGIYQNINDEIEEEEFDGEDEDYDDTEDELVDIDEYEKFGYKNNDNVLQSENYFNFVSRELVELLKLQEPQVIIEPVNSDHIIDHGNKNFDIEELLDQQFNDDDNV